MAWPSGATRGASVLKKLANRRFLAAGEVRGIGPIALLYQWYCHGFIHLT